MIAWGAPYTERMAPLDAPRLLAIDSATERLSVAVTAGERQWTAEEEGGARASLRLLPLAFELLAAAGMQVSQLDAVAFGCGPGAFTGLRSACSAAQGLALGLGCQVLPLDSLALVAEDALSQHIDAAQGLWVAMDARMDEVYAGAYRYDGGAWQAVIEPALWTLPALAAAWASSPPHVVAGSAVTAFEGRLPVGRALCVPASRDRAAALARLARAAWARGGAVDAADALPLYLRDKVALTIAERETAKA
jgi:tRNA threonylcarbamoyladenosine biosynthesis protein TsaB